jgi:hypothetical protein
MTKKAQRARVTFALSDRPFGGKNYLRLFVLLVFDKDVQAVDKPLRRKAKWNRLVVG